MPVESTPSLDQLEEQPEVLPPGDTPLDSSKPTEPPSQRLSGRMIVEEALSMITHGPMRDPLLEKMGPKQIDRTLELQATRDGTIDSGPNLVN